MSFWSTLVVAMIDRIVSRLTEINIKVETDVPLSNYTTLKVGGPVQMMIWIDTIDKFIEMLVILNKFKLPYFILGNGSNLLVSDKGVKGAAVRLRGKVANVDFYGNTAEAGGGALLNSVVNKAHSKSLGGLEFTIGIPGTVGGAIMINAGAFNRTIANVISRAQTITRDGEIRTYNRFENHYREPLVPRGETVIRAWFNLKSRDASAIKEKIEEHREKRRKNQPWGMPTAGSIFKNPEGDYAGRLIEECGLKGVTVGGAKVSEVHSNFIINEGNATADNIKTLIELTREKVKVEFGIELQPEVQFIGIE